MLPFPIHSRAEPLGRLLERERESSSREKWHGTPSASFTSTTPAPFQEGSITAGLVPAVDTFFSFAKPLPWTALLGDQGSASGRSDGSGLRQSFCKSGRGSWTAREHIACRCRISAASGPAAAALLPAALRISADQRTALRCCAHLCDRELRRGGFLVRCSVPASHCNAATAASQQAARNVGWGGFRPEDERKGTDGSVSRPRNSVQLPVPAAASATACRPAADCWAGTGGVAGRTGPWTARRSENSFSRAAGPCPEDSPFCGCAVCWQHRCGTDRQRAACKDCPEARHARG